MASDLQRNMTAVRSGFLWSLRDRTASIFVLCVIGLAIVALGPANAYAQSSLEKAIEEYTQAMETKDRDARLLGFTRAELLFRDAVDGDAMTGRSGVRNADLLVNLGNAALQAEHVGAAIFAYREALQLDANHSTAQQNLAYARSTLPEWARAPASTGVTDTLFFWRASLSRKATLTVSGLCFLVAAAFFAAGLLRSLPLMRNVALIPLAGCGLLLISLFVQVGEADATNAVLIRDGSILRSADSENAPPRLSNPLPDGAELTVVQRRDGWVEVEIAGRRGWLPESNVRRLDDA